MMMGFFGGCAEKNRQGKDGQVVMKFWKLVHIRGGVPG